MNEVDVICVLEGVPFFYEISGEWHLVRLEELPELAKESPYITCEDIANDLDFEGLEGQMIRITVESMNLKKSKSREAVGLK